MSIRRKPEKAIPVLLARLHKVKEYVLEDAKNRALAPRFEEIEEELKGMTNTFPTIKNMEKNVTEQLCVLEKELDDDIFFNYKDLEMENEVLVSLEEKLECIKGDITKLRSLVSWVDKGVNRRLSTMTFKHRGYLPPMNDGLRTVSQEWVDLRIEDEIFRSQAMLSLFASFHRLESSQVKMCSLCLSIFPEKSIIKKKPIIYWWIGEGLVTRSGNTTAEEAGEQIMQELLSEGFIRPSSENKSVNSFVVCPWIRRMLIQIAKESSFLDFNSQWMPCNGRRRAFLWQQRNVGELREENVLSVFNVNEQYLGGTRLEWMTGLKRVEVLQLGRWQSCATHHIEVEDERVLMHGLGSQKHLKYLSLRGISRIETLPPSISKLISLQILDLRACHNLESIPRGISALKNLTHLDVSECYLLESMPKGLDQLLALQVLKGFVIGGGGGKNSSKISDLARLNNLRKLSIRVGNYDEAQQEGQLGSLRRLPALRILVISWGLVSAAPEAHTYASLPSSLTKLDLRLVPFSVVPQWLWPSRLPNLDKLYINGGKLNDLDHKDSQLEWISVKFVRLKYLKQLKIDLDKLKSLFPQRLYLERVNCYRLDPDIILKD